MDNYKTTVVVYVKQIDIKLIKLHKTTEPNDFNFPSGNVINFVLDEL